MDYIVRNVLVLLLSVFEIASSGLPNLNLRLGGHPAESVTGPFRRQNFGCTTATFIY